MDDKAGIQHQIMLLDTLGTLFLLETVWGGAEEAGVGAAQTSLSPVR